MIGVCDSSSQMIRYLRVGRFAKAAAVPSMLSHECQNYNAEADVVVALDMRSGTYYSVRQLPRLLCPPKAERQ